MTSISNNSSFSGLPVATVIAEGTLAGEIAQYAFQNCSSLTKFGTREFIEDNSTVGLKLENVTGIGNYAFTYCTELAAVNLPKVTTVGIGAFNSCQNLNSISMDKVKEIKASAFAGCVSLSVLTLPDSLERIEG